MMARAAKRSASLGDSDDQQLGSSLSPGDDVLGSGSAAATGTGGALPPPRKRKRRVVSCAECHRRKQKCDRNMPCKACVDRNMEASCHYETVAMSRERHHMRIIEAATYGRALQAGGSLPVKAAGFGYAETNANTLGFLQKIDRGRLAGANGGGGGGGGGGGDGDIGGLLGLNEGGVGGLDGASLASMVSEDADGMTIVPTAAAAEAVALAEQQFYYQQQNAQQNPSQSLSKQATRQQQQESHQLIHSQHPSFDHQHHQRPQIGDPYGTADRYRALVRELPPRPAIDRLVAIYFKDFNWNYYSVDEDVFLKQLADWSDVATGPFGTLQSPYQLAPDLRAFPALLFNLMATALLMLEPNSEDDMAFFDDIKHASNATFEDLALDYSEAGMGILSLLGKRQMSFTTVLAGFTRAAFLKYVALITEAWHVIGGAIRDAQEVGLHRSSMDPKPFAQTAEAVLENQWEIQRRRRLWMTLVSWDLQMGVILGRPITVDLSVQLAMPIDCVLPATVAERSTMPVQPRGENDPPTPLTRVIWAYEAIAPLRRILELEKDGPCPRDFGPVDRLHEKLVEIEASTPPFFRLENPDTRFDDLPGCAWLRSVRATMPQVAIFNYMALHRPYIFTRAKSRTEALKACIRMLQIQRVHFASLKPQQYKTFSLFFGTFDSLVLMAAIYILFPKEHPELLPEAIQHYRWSVERFEIMMDHYSLAKSALGVLHAIYLRLRKTLGVSFLENEHGLGGVSGPGSAPVDALTMSNIDPSLKDEGPVFAAGSKEDRGGGPGRESGANGQSGAYGHVASGSISTNSGLTPGTISSGSAASSAGSDIFSNSIATGGRDTPTAELPHSGGGLGGGSMSGTGGLDQAAPQQQQQGDSKPAVSSDLLDPQLAQQTFGGAGGDGLPDPQDQAASDSIFPDNFDWSSLPPICPTGDLAYSVLLGVSDGSAAAWGGGGGGVGPMGGIGGPGTISSRSMDLLTGANGIHGGTNSLSADLDAANAAAAAAVEAAQATTAAESEAGARPSSVADGPGANPSVDGTVIPWQFEGDFGNNSLWGLLNNYTPF